MDKTHVLKCKCGNQPHIGIRYSEGMHYYSVVCIRCFSETREFYRKIDAIEKWNKKQERILYDKTDV